MAKRQAGHWKGKALTVCVGILFLLIFSYTSSPLFPHFYGWDSAFFQWVGAGMTKGFLPYRDYFDMKGPWLFLLEYAGQLLCYGRTGAFLMQVLNFSLALLFLWRMLERQQGSWQDALFVFLPLFLLWASTMEGGGNTEELSLAVLMAAFCPFLSWTRSKQESHPPRFAFVYGACFGVLALIRIINGALICAMVGTAVIILALHGKWKNLWQNALAFLGGVAAAFVIPLLYFGWHGEIREMLYCTFAFGFTYGTEGFGYGAGKFFLPLAFFPLFVEAVTGEKNKKAWIFSGLWAFGMIVALGMGNSTMHDYTLLAPGLAYGMLAFCAARENLRENPFRLRLFALVTALLLLYPGYKMARTLGEVAALPENQLYAQTKEIIEKIPKEERNSVYGYAVPLRFYWIGDLAPYSRYCGWQEHYMELVPSIEKEIEEMMRGLPPRWLVCKGSEEIQNGMMQSFLWEDYELAGENESYQLYRLKRAE